MVWLTSKGLLLKGSEFLECACFAVVSPVIDGGFESDLRSPAIGPMLTALCRIHYLTIVHLLSTLHVKLIP